MRQFDGTRLRQIRTQRGFRPEALALQINRSVQTLHAYEVGRAQPPVTVLCRLADALGVEVETLLTPFTPSDLHKQPEKG